MVQALGLVRRWAVVSAAAASLGLGWVLLWHLMPPAVASRVPTGVLATVIVLQVLPVLAWVSWRADRRQASEEPSRPPAMEEAVSAEPTERTGPSAERGGERPEVVPVHRVIHVPRSKPARVHGHPHHHTAGGARA